VAREGLLSPVPQDKQVLQATRGTGGTEGTGELVRAASQGRVVPLARPPEQEATTWAEEPGSQASPEKVGWLAPLLAQEVVPVWVETRGPVGTPALPGMPEGEGSQAAVVPVAQAQVPAAPEPQGKQVPQARAEAEARAEVEAKAEAKAEAEARAEVEAKAEAEARAEAKAEAEARVERETVAVLELLVKAVRLVQGVVLRFLCAEMETSINLRKSAMGATLGSIPAPSS